MFLFWMGFGAICLVEVELVVIVAGTSVPGWVSVPLVLVPSNGVFVVLT
jgi:hypothetical protein